MNSDRMIVFCILGLLALSSAAEKVVPTEKYSHHATLKSDNIKLYWKFNDTHITFEVSQTLDLRTVGSIYNGLSTRVGPCTAYF